MYKEQNMEKIIKKIQEIHQDNLISLYLYGEQIGKQQSMLLILNQANEENLKKHKAIQKTILKENIKLDIFTQKEAESALDVFPIEFMEMKENRELLAGIDILKEIKIDPANLRHECEFYLRSNILKLRSGYLTPLADLAELIQISLPSFLLVFKYLLVLDNQPIPKEKTAMIETLAKKIKFNPQIFNQILQNFDSKKLLATYFASYLKELEIITNQVDTL
jgi:hypothetical protein